MFGHDTLFLQRFLRSLDFYDGDLDGDFGPLTSAALDRFEDASDRIAAAGGRFDMRSERNIVTLHPTAQALARRFLAEVRRSPRLAAERAGAKIISGTRTYAEQAELFAQGRTRPGKIVTNAPAGRSNHNFGVAWDVGIFRDGEYVQESALYDAVGAIGQSVGLEWGGEWSSFVDKPHFQLRLGLKLAELRERFEAGLAFA